MFFNHRCEGRLTEGSSLSHRLSKIRLDGPSTQRYYKVRSNHYLNNFMKVYVTIKPVMSVNKESLAQSDALVIILIENNNNN